MCENNLAESDRYFLKAEVVRWLVIASMTTFFFLCDSTDRVIISFISRPNSSILHSSQGTIHALILHLNHHISKKKKKKTASMCLI